MRFSIRPFRQEVPLPTDTTEVTGRIDDSRPFPVFVVTFYDGICFQLPILQIDRDKLRPIVQVEQCEIPQGDGWIFRANAEELSLKHDDVETREGLKQLGYDAPNYNVLVPLLSGVRVAIGPL